MPKTKRIRCPNGTRKNKKTGVCESVIDIRCSICLENITPEDVKTKCQHKFHKNCLVAWCKSNKKCECPNCRKDIKSICKKIMPFDSTEVFRYIPTYGELTPLQKEQALEIMQNSNFDVNVRRPSGGSGINQSNMPLLHTLVKLRNSLTLIEFLLKQPEIKVSDELVSYLISAKTGDGKLELLKKYKKVPKHLKNLV